MSGTGLLVVVAVVVLACGYGVVHGRRQGRLRAGAGERVRPSDVPASFGERATLLQFSSAFCRPCVATRQVLGAVAAAVPGVAHVEVDAESHLDLVRALDVASTPTTLLLDRTGVIRRRATGVPTRAAVLAALDEIVG